MPQRASNNESNVHIHPPEHTWSNTLPKAIAECLQNREEPAADLAAEWLREHENDDVVWTVLNQMLDRFERLASSHEETHGE